MARARNIKPGLFKNEILGIADPLYTILFEGLWVLADRAGRLEDRPLRIKAEVLPYRDGADVDAMLSWLQANGFITRYEVDGKKCIAVCEFVKHQNPHKNEAESDLPSPDDARSTSGKIGSTRADSLSSDSLNIDSLIEADQPVAPAKPSPSVPEKREPAPTIEGVPESLLKDWKKVRTAKRAGPISQTVIDALQREAAAAGITVEQAVRICVERGWQGFKAEWYAGSSGAGAMPPGGGQKPGADGVGRSFV